MGYGRKEKDDVEGTGFPIARRGGAAGCRESRSLILNARDLYIQSDQPAGHIEQAAREVRIHGRGMA